MYEADSMGMSDFSRDNTKVVNEERNDLPPVTADEVEATTGDDVEMVDVNAPQGDTVLTETSQPASSMDVDGAEPKIIASASPTTLTQELASVAVADNLLASDKQASTESAPVLDGAATTNPAMTALEVNKDDMAKAKSLDPTAELEASDEPKPTPAASLPAAPDLPIDGKQAELTDAVNDAVNDAKAVQSVEADAKADTENATDSGTGANAADQLGISPSPVTDSIADGIAGLAVDVASAEQSALATPAHLTDEPSSETVKDNAGSEGAPSSQSARPPARANAPVHKAVLNIKLGDREDGEATEDDYDDEDGEIRDSQATKMMRAMFASRIMVQVAHWYCQ
ncbi:hypothetical protein GGH13_004878 [Coemansia sp. S155-1]|nr:hypothetical protein GGH13_004878 [Coemansia sp. S155-1]